MESEAVSFVFDGETKAGYVYTVDRFGTFDFPHDVCYDIMVESEHMLYKHIPESRVKKQRRKKETHERNQVQRKS